MIMSLEEIRRLASMMRPVLVGSAIEYRMKCVSPNLEGTNEFDAKDIKTLAVIG
jgi:hypothetical protein